MTCSRIQQRHDVLRRVAIPFLGVALTYAVQSIAEPHTPTPESRPETVELAWARSPDADLCLSGSDLKAAVRARLGRDPFTEPFQKQIDGYVSRRGDTWLADLTVRERGTLVGKRHLESATADCRELDQAVSLTVTLIIDPNAASHVDAAPLAVTASTQTTSQKNGAPATNSVNAPAPNASEGQAGGAQSDTNSHVETPTATPAAVGVTRNDGAGPASVGVAASAAPAKSQTEPASAIATRLLVAPSFAYQLLPSLTTGVVFRSELALRKPFELGLSAAFYPEHRRRVMNTEVGFGLTAFEVAGCYRPDRAVTLFVCGSGWLGAAQSVVHVGTPERPGTQVWAALRGDLGIAATSERLVAELRLFGISPLTRLRYLDSDQNAIFVQPALVPGAEVGVGVRFP